MCWWICHFTEQREKCFYSLLRSSQGFSCHPGSCNCSYFSSQSPRSIRQHQIVESEDKKVRLQFLFVSWKLTSDLLHRKEILGASLTCDQASLFLAAGKLKERKQAWSQVRAIRRSFFTGGRKIKGPKKRDAWSQVRASLQFFTVVTPPWPSKYESNSHSKTTTPRK